MSKRVRQSLSFISYGGEGAGPDFGISPVSRTKELLGGIRLFTSFFFPLPSSFSLLRSGYYFYSAARLPFTILYFISVLSY